jgi:hypothetical protein
MKKSAVLPILIVMIFVSKSIFAQDSETKLFHFGLKAAPVVSWFVPDNKKFSNAGSQLGFGYGLITEFGFSKNYAFSTGLDILNSGGRLNFPSSPDSTFYDVLNETTNVNEKFLLHKRTYRLRYVNVPLHLKLKTNQIGSMTYFGEFGFDVSILWKARSDDDGSFIGSSPTTRQDVDLAGDANFLRLALNVGLGAEYNLSGSTSLVISVNYDNGFTNALRTNSKTLYDKNDNKLVQKAMFNYVGLSVGVLF